MSDGDENLDTAFFTMSALILLAILFVAIAIVTALVDAVLK